MAVRYIAIFVENEINMLSFCFIAGLIDNKSRVDLVISFTPHEYCTTHMLFQVLISEFNARPLICSVSGTSTPGLSKE